MIKEKINNYIKDIAKEAATEAVEEKTDKIEKAIELERDKDGVYRLPEVKKNELLACSIQKTHKDLISSTPAGAAMDAVCPVDKLNNAYNICNPVNDVIYTHFAVQGFIGFQACAILCQNWLINKACTIPAKDAIRPAYELSYVTTDDEEEIDKDFLTEITDESNDLKGFNIKSVCSTFAQKKRQFGQVLAFPIVEGANYELPFNMDSIQADSYKGMTVVDPVWYTPILDEEAVSNPQSLRYMKPTYFQMPDGKKVHHSWCIFGVNGEVSDVLLPTYHFGGYPIPQLIYERVYCAEKTANEAHMLAQSKRLLIADINVKSYMTNPNNTVKELEALTQFRDNWGVMTKRPGDSVQQIDTSLTDLDEVIMTQYQLAAAAACVPATKLLETQPKGFNSTGDYEDKQYKLTLAEIQNADYIPILDFHYALLSKSKYGITRDYTITFKEIDTPTELERAQINQTKAQTDSVYVQSGILSPDEVRDNLIKDPNSGYNDIQGELPEDEFNFTDEPEQQEGNGETQQNPFSEDEFNLDEWKEEEHPRNEEGEFTAGNSANTSTENLNKNENFKQEVESVIEKAKDNPNERASVDVGDVSSKLTKDAKEQGYDISGYKHNVDVCGVRHAFNKHGKPTEYKRGQIPLDDDDIKAIPEILYNYDEVIFGEKTRKGVDLIKYKKQMPDNTTFYVEEIRTGKKTLTTKTIYKISR